jgi:hypothetical protein
MTRRSSAAITLGAGFLIIVAARLAGPAAPPLYDGVIPVEPYVWLDPPPGHPGGALGASADFEVIDGQSPLITVTTPELAPQAQLFAPPGGLTVPAGARTIHVSIEPVRPEVLPTIGHIDGNVYRMSVTDEDGTALTAPADAQVTVVLRSSDPTLVEASISKLVLGVWQPASTSSSGFGGTFLAVVTTFGDVAVIAPGPGPSGVATAVPSVSAGAGGSSAPSPTASGPEPSPAPGDGTSGPPGWLLVGAGLLALGLVALAGYAASLRRRTRYQGAHRIRRD